MSCFLFSLSLSSLTSSVVSLSARILSVFLHKSPPPSYAHTHIRMSKSTQHRRVAIAFAWSSRKQPINNLNITNSCWYYPNYEVHYLNVHRNIVNTVKYVHIFSYFSRFLYRNISCVWCVFFFLLLLYLIPLSFYSLHIFTNIRRINNIYAIVVLLWFLTHCECHCILHHIILDWTIWGKHK